MKNRIKEYLLDLYYDLSDRYYNYKYSKRERDIEKAMTYCYRQSFKKATPSADFDKLVKNAPLNERGQKVINFMDYYLDSESLEKIIEKSIKKYHINERSAAALRFSVLLGCSPTSCKKEENDK